MIEGWAAAAVAVGAVSAGVAAYGASAQAGAAKNAQNIAQNQYQNTVNLENPYNQAGVGATNELNYLEGIGSNQNPDAQSGGGNLGGYGSLNQTFNASNFQQLSPAYGFQLQQGQQGVLNADAANEGALSGAAQKDLIGYSQNFANTSFNNAFNQYQTQQGNIYSRLANIANLGQSAASGTAQQGTALAGQAGQAAQNVGTAYANGATGVANSLSQGGLLAAYGGGGSSATSSDPNAYTAPSSGSWSADGSTWIP
jgi:hypothetical protein